MDKTGYTLMHLLAERGDMDLLKSALAGEAGRREITQPDANGLTPLLVAALHAKDGVVEYIIRHQLCERRQEVEALELLGASCLEVTGSVEEAVRVWTRALEERSKEGLVKPLPDPRAPNHLNAVEVQDVCELQAMQESMDQLHMQALLIRQRVLGPRHPSTVYHLHCRADSLDRARQHRHCLCLFLHVLASNRALYGMDEGTSKRFLDCMRLLGHVLQETKGAGLGDRQVGAGLGDIEVAGAGLGERHWEDFGDRRVAGVGAGLGDRQGVGAGLGDRQGVGAGLGERQRVEAGLGDRQGVGAGLGERQGAGLGEEYGELLLALLEHTVEELESNVMAEDGQRYASTHDVMVLLLHLLVVMTHNVPSLHPHHHHHHHHHHRYRHSESHHRHPHPNRHHPHKDCRDHPDPIPQHLGEDDPPHHHHHPRSSNHHHHHPDNHHHRHHHPDNHHHRHHHQDKPNNRHIHHHHYNHHHDHHPHSSNASSTVPKFLRLVQRAVKLDPRGESGFALLHMACSVDTAKERFRLGDFFFPSLLVTQLLLRVGADPSARAHKAVTPLHVITRAANVPYHNGIVRTLMARGAHVDACDAESGTPLSNLGGLRGPVRGLRGLACPVRDVSLQCLAARVVLDRRLAYRGVLGQHLHDFLQLH